MLDFGLVREALRETPAAAHPARPAPRSARALPVAADPSRLGTALRRSRACCCTTPWAGAVPCRARRHLSKRHAVRLAPGAAARRVRRRASSSPTRRRTTRGWSPCWPEPPPRTVPRSLTRSARLWRCRRGRPGRGRPRPRPADRAPIGDPAPGMWRWLPVPWRPGDVDRRAGRCGRPGGEAGRRAAEGPAVQGRAHRRARATASRWPPGCSPAPRRACCSSSRGASTG